MRSRGLPDDHVGLVRVVEMKGVHILSVVYSILVYLMVMAGIDSNMCCGTHVKNLSDIQVCYICIICIYICTYK